MRRRIKDFLLWIVWTTLLIALALATLWVLDNVFNGLVLDRLAATVRTDLDWNEIKLIGTILLVSCCTLLSTTGCVCARIAARRQRERDVRMITSYAQALEGTAKNGDHLPAEFSEIEAPLLRMKQDAVRAKELAEMEMQRKSDLITYLAHDLKTPLASVVAYLNLLEESPELPPEQRAKYVGIALQKAYRLEQLIGELFEIIRFNLQTISLSDEKINLGLMLAQLADEFYPILLAQNKRISVDCPDGLTLRGDSDKLARVFNNILRNAAAYSYPDTEIRVCAKASEDRVLIAFRNQGDPIPEQKRALIFEKFYRLDSARSTQTGGAGLGLAIAREIVEAHGGEIAVDSNRTRTVFLVRLPARE